MIDIRTLSNGLRVLMEPLDTASSLSMHCLVPAGSAHDTDALDGIAPLFLEMAFRGANSMNTKELSEAFDRAGMQRSAHVGARFIRFQATTTADRLDDAVPLLLGMAFTPSLPDRELDSVKRLCQQSLASLPDDPQEETGLLLRTMHVDRPFHRTGMGVPEGLSSVSMDDLRHRRDTCCRPGGAIVSACGGFDAEALFDAVQRQAEQLHGTASEAAYGGTAPRGRHLLVRPTAQVHIALAWDAARIGAPEEDLDRLVCAVLGGTTSGRLFTEVRQRRSLCYAVSSRYAANSLQGSCILRAGTTPDNAGELLDVCLGEIERLAVDISADEVLRTRRTLIDALVLQGESTQSRAARLAHVMANRGTCPTMQERIAQLERISPEQVIEHARSWAAIVPTIVAVGPAGCLPFPECAPVA